MDYEHAYDSVDCLPGIGEARKASFLRGGIETLSDLLYRFPRAYENRGNIKQLSCALDGTPTAFLLTVATSPHGVRIRKNMYILKFRAFDDSGSVEVVFFNMPYLRDVFSVGKTYRFYGRLSEVKRRRFQLIAPKFEPYEEGDALPAIVPIYRTLDGIPEKTLIASIRGALSLVLPHLEDPLPEDIRRRYHLQTLTNALREIHFPKSEEGLSEALRRMVFAELFCFAIGLARLRQSEKEYALPALTDGDLSPFLNALPYRLTAAQRRAVNDFQHDIIGDGSQIPNTVKPMTRILIGDVGSGKTVAAAAAMYLIAKNGFQCVMMVPTEILARQHFNDLSPLFSSLGIRTALLTGSMKKREKDAVYRALSLDFNEKDAIDILIGTHAVLNEQVVLPRLSLTVTDEQHRFGIMQRATLREKNCASHLLVMSATPIPRTLALAMYGDLDVSHIDEIPKGRSPVETFLVDSSYRERLNGFIEKNVAAGGQVYIVCPSIDEEDDALGTMTDPTKKKISSMPPLKAAVSYADELASNVFPARRVAFLHGKMKSAERDSVMQSFASGEIDILVSTTVIEVGVNVPNACLMIIENAERFGLSQLHQLRGRVGRGQRQSYCILLSDMKGGTAEDRLRTLCRERDGYKIAEADLAKRGPGDFFASASSGLLRQSGDIPLHFIGLCDDSSLMHDAFSAAKEIIKTDPYLKADENRLLLKEVNRLFEARQSTVS